MASDLRRLAGQFLPAVFALFALFGIPPTAGHAAGMPPGGPALFVEASAPAARPGEPVPGLVRGRAVTVAREALRPLRPGESRLDLNLFADTHYTGLVDTVRPHPSGAISYSGRLAEDEHGAFALVENGDAVAGMVRTDDGQYYEVGTLEGETHYVRQIAQSALPPCGNAPEHVVSLENLPPAAPRAAAAPAPDASAAAEPDTVIDLMIVYTVAAANRAGGNMAIQARAQLAVDLANQAYANSAILARLRLVHTALVAYTEVSGASGFNTALSDLTGKLDGKMDNVHSLRDEYGADIVSLFVANGSYCGLGWVMTSTSHDFSTHGFNVISYDCTNGLTLAHEIGHNQGSQHDRENAVSSNGQPLAGLYPYSYGWRYTGANNTLYRTVMAYDPGARIPYFSNPNITYQGRPTGVSIGAPNEADNATSINNTRAIVAAWRTVNNTPSIELAGTTLTAEECLPWNGAVDPGEKVTMNIALKNAGGGSANVSAALVGGNGVAPITTAAQSYGALAAGGAAVARPFQFRVYGECGAKASVTLRLTEDGQFLGYITIPLRLGAFKGLTGRASYESGGQVITIPSGSTIESKINVPVEGYVGDLAVNVRLNYAATGKLVLTLIAPDGAQVVLSDRNGGNGANLGTGANGCYGTYTVFDDSATSAITDAANKPPYAGRFRPQQPLSVLAGGKMKGDWTLRITADSGVPSGALGCWKLEVAREQYQCCLTRLTLPEARQALDIAGGKAAATPEQMLRLNVNTAAPSADRVDITDAVAAARQANGK